MQNDCVFLGFSMPVLDVLEMEFLSKFDLSGKLVMDGFRFCSLFETQKRGIKRINCEPTVH